MTNKASSEEITTDFQPVKNVSTFRASFFKHVGRTQSLSSSKTIGSVESDEGWKIVKNDVVANITTNNIQVTSNMKNNVTPPPGFDKLERMSPKKQEKQAVSDEEKCFSMAKRTILMKTHNNHQSAGDLTQYINPDLLMGRRSSLHQNTTDPQDKKVRQKEAYKTAMCQAWLQGRSCAFADQCSFAHGEEELQPLPANRPNPKFKTRICENYTTTGICPFGNRCFFIHPPPNAKIEDVIEYKEALDQRARELEGKAIIQQEGDLVSNQQIVASPKANKKAKQFRKLESCGNFYTQFQLQQIQQAQLQQHIQNECQAIFTAGVLAQTAKTLENKAIELEIKKQQIEQQSQANFSNYENFPLNSPTNGNFGIFSKGPSSRFAAIKNSAISGSMPLIHSNSAGNLVFQQPNSKMNAEKFADDVFDPPKSYDFKRSTLIPSDIMFGGNDVLDLSDKDSSGPHTPPSFYQNHIVPKCCRGNQWGSLTSSHHHNHENTIWPSTVDSPELKNQHKEVLPSFSLFGPENFNNSVSGSGGDLLKICGSKNDQLLGGSYCSGKRSPIMGEFMNGLLSGRRSSHTPLLDEGGGENAQAMLKLLLEPGCIQKVNNHRANRSVEVLSRAKVIDNTGELIPIGAEKKDSDLLKVISISPSTKNSWEGGARSTGALNEQFETKLIEEFGPPPGFEPKGKEIMVIGGEKRLKEMDNKLEMTVKHEISKKNEVSIKHEISIKHELSKSDEMSIDRIIREKIGKLPVVNCLFGRHGSNDSDNKINTCGLRDEEDKRVLISPFHDYNGVTITTKSNGDDRSVDNDSCPPIFGSSFPSTAPITSDTFRPINELLDDSYPPLKNSSPYGSNSSLRTQVTSNIVSSLRKNLEQIWASSLPEIDQSSNNNNKQINNKTNLNKLEENSNKTKVNTNNEIKETNIKLCYSDIVKKTVKSEEVEVSGQQIEIIGLPCENVKDINLPKNFEPGSGEQTWAMRAIRKSCLGGKSTSSPSLSRSISMGAEQTVNKMESK
ncbi:hypothetical protein ACQ4LE_005371 [Meloidogyne hapla]